MGSHKKKKRSTSSSNDEGILKKHKEKKTKKKSKSKKEKRKEKKKFKEMTTQPNVEKKTISCDIPLGLMEKSKLMAPITKEEWEKKQNTVRRVYDETTGRHRLIKGDGEVIEEIVSRDRHKAINEQATRGDGTYFQSKMGVGKK